MVLNIFHFHTDPWGRFPIWLISFRWVETTNQGMMSFFFAHPKTLRWNKRHRNCSSCSSWLHARCHRLDKKSPKFSQDFLDFSGRMNWWTVRFSRKGVPKVWKKAIFFKGKWSMIFHLLVDNMNETKSSDFFRSLMRRSWMNVWKIRFELISPKRSWLFFQTETMPCHVLSSMRCYVNVSENTLPETSMLPLKINGCKRIFLLGPGLFPEANC